MGMPLELLRDEFNFYVVNGVGNEFGRLFIHGRSHIPMVGITDSLIFWIYNSMAVQLLEIKKIG